MNFFKQLLKIWNSLEIHNSTKDVEDGMKSLLLKKRFINSAFWSILIIVSGVSFFTALDKIKEKEMRANLIDHVGVDPIPSLFYDDYEEEKEMLTKAISTKNEQKWEIEKTYGAAPMNRPYGFNDFLKDAREGKIDLPFGANMRGNNAFKEYQKNIYLTRLVQDKDNTVSLNGTVYTYMDISKKLRVVRNKNERVKMLRAPSVKILEKWKMFVSEDTIRAMSEALKKLDKLGTNWIAFYKELELDPRGAHEAMKSAMLDGKHRYKFVNKKGDSYETAMNTQWLFDEFELIRAEKEQERLKALAAYMEKKKKSEKKVGDINSQISELNRGLYFIQNLQTDVVNYDSHEGNLTAVLDELNKKGEISWKN